MVQPKIDSHCREKAYREATNPERVDILRHDMIRIRERQQEENARRAKEAKEAAEKKRIEEMRRKRIEDPDTNRGGQRLGRGAGDSSNTSTSVEKKKASGNESVANPSGRGSYSPLNPSSGSTSGYRPATRNPNRS